MTKNRAPRNGADRGLLGYNAHKNNLDKSDAALQLMIHMYVERILIKYRFHFFQTLIIYPIIGSKEDAKLAIANHGQYTGAVRYVMCIIRFLVKWTTDPWNKIFSAVWNEHYFTCSQCKTDYRSRVMNSFNFPPALTCTSFPPSQNLINQNIMIWRSIVKGSP